MESVGQELRRERLQAGLTLEQVSAKTRISIKNLQAIENDDLRQINSPFFYKSFVRQFAEQVNLDYSRLAPAVQIGADAMPQPLVPGQETLSQEVADLRKIPAIRIKRPKNFRWFSSVASLLVMLVGCSTLYAIWQNAKRDWHSSMAGLIQPVKPQPRNPEPVRGQNVARRTESIPKHTQQKSQRERMQPSSLHTDSNLNSQINSIPQPPVSSSSDSSSKSEQLNPASESEAAVRVELSVLERTWLSVVEDGKETFSGILEAAETKVLEGHETASIRTGNAGGLSLIFNGKLIGTVGARGQVRTVVFTRDNYEVLESSAHISLTHFNSGLE